MIKSTLGSTDLAEAWASIEPLIEKTPVMTSGHLNEITGAQLFFKCEHLQTTGSFKLRGATHAVGLLPVDCPGVATHSSGNHGAALACAAARRDLRAEIVVPENAGAAKLANIRRHGARVHFCRPDQASREAALDALAQQGLEAIPPYDDDRIIAGQGSTALEMFTQVDGLDALVVPVGGGGLVSGCALAAQMTKVPPRVIGVEPLGADDTARSLALGQRVDNSDHHPDTVADGLRALIGKRNFQLVSELVERVVTVSDAQIMTAALAIWRELRQVTEPSGATALAGVLANPNLFADRRVGVIISGGNIDPESFSAALEAHGRE
ncbi:MAG TPA: pyridoxal-phosphate dependent enzyme [Wenzhouxiangella sp.]|nr:pyridoxal-phosphate dependent enzyme [Wenzhouxiangella sp.]